MIFCCFIIKLEKWKFNCTHSLALPKQLEQQLWQYNFCFVEHVEKYGQAGAEKKESRGGEGKNIVCWFLFDHKFIKNENLTLLIPWWRSVGRASQLKANQSWSVQCWTSGRAARARSTRRRRWGRFLMPNIFSSRKRRWRKRNKILQTFLILSTFPLLSNFFFDRIFCSALITWLPCKHRHLYPGGVSNGYYP